jgi:hypothetical protein
MAKRANRGRGGKKNLKLVVQEASAVMEDGANSLNGDGLSEEEANCEHMECGDTNLDINSQSLPVGGDFIAELNGNCEKTVYEEKNLSEAECSEFVKEKPVADKLEQRNSVQDWRQLFRSEKSLGALQYFEPSREKGKVVVKPPKVAIEEGILKWSSSLVGQFLDKPLPYYIVKRTVDILWASFGKVEVFLLENGLYLFRFQNEKARDEIMEAKLWHIANKPLILRKWAPGMQLLKLSLSTVPVWVKLHNLPIEYWNSTCLSYVASGIGKPLCADSVTEEQLRLGFARVLIEVNVDSEFPKEIEIEGADGVRVTVGIEYPWLPVKCKKCRSFGHLAHNCTRMEKQVWIPRNPVPAQKKVAEVQLVNAPRVAANEQWTEVRSVRRTPVSKPMVRENQHWTNSFHLLARADGKFESGKARGSGAFSNSLQKVIENALSEENESLLINKGKGKMGEDEEVLMRGFSPT